MLYTYITIDMVCVCVYVCVAWGHELIPPHPHPLSHNLASSHRQLKKLYIYVTDRLGKATFIHIHLVLNLYHMILRGQNIYLKIFKKTIFIEHPVHNMLYHLYNYLTPWVRPLPTLHCSHLCTYIYILCAWFCFYILKIFITDLLPHPVTFPSFPPYLTLFFVRHTSSIGRNGCSFYLHFDIKSNPRGSTLYVSMRHAAAYHVYKCLFTNCFYT